MHKVSKKYLNKFTSSLHGRNFLYYRLNDCIELLEDMEENGLLDMDKVRSHFADFL